MPIRVLLPSYLRSFAGGRREVALSPAARTVAEALEELWRLHPGLRDRVLTERGAVRPYVNIFVGQANIRDAGGLAAPVSEGCEILIVPNVAGGCPGQRG